MTKPGGNASMASMAAATTSFRWMDLLEKEFDKNFVALEEVFKMIAADYEMVDMYESNRKLLSALGSCFVQAVHKAQTIFQANAKFEAELIHLREELAESKATMAKLHSEKKYLVCRLQSALLDNHKLKTSGPAGAGGGGGIGGIGAGGSPTQEDAVCQDIQLKLAEEMAVIQRVDWDARKTEERCRRVEVENARLRLNMVDMESELVGARLDSKYLDKELAGRIQQIQILLASGTSQDHKQRVWSQIESEMHLQRSKTISNMCYSKQKVKDQARRMTTASGDDKAPASSHNGVAPGDSGGGGSGPGGGDNTEASSRKSSVNAKNCVKQVMLHKNDSEELGMAILGGHEHGLPIMISEVFPNTAIGRCKKICAGDIILAVNGDSFTDFGHDEAVRYLSALRGTIKFTLENRVDGETDDVCDMANRYYSFLNVGSGGGSGSDDGSAFADGEGLGRGVKAMSPGGLIMHRHPGRAMDTRKDSRGSGSRERTNSDASNSTRKEELPEVHTSPARKGGDCGQPDVAKGSEQRREL